MIQVTGQPLSVSQLKEMLAVPGVGGLKFSGLAIYMLQVREVSIVVWFRPAAQVSSRESVTEWSTLSFAGASDYVPSELLMAAHKLHSAGPIKCLSSVYNFKQMVELAPATISFLPSLWRYIAFELLSKGGNPQLEQSLTLWMVISQHL